MKCLTTTEVDGWWAKRPELFAENGRTPGRRLASRRVGANFEKAQTSTYAVARAMAGWLQVYDGHVLASVFEYGVWPSSENLHLYYTWRRSQGDHNLLEDAPGHVFLKHEMADLATLLQLAFLFGWGLSCAETDGERAFHVDHDGHGMVIGRSLDDLPLVFPV